MYVCVHVCPCLCLSMSASASSVFCGLCLCLCVDTFLCMVLAFPVFPMSVLHPFPVQAEFVVFLHSTVCSMSDISDPSLPAVGFSHTGPAVGDSLADHLADTSLPVAEPSLPVVGFPQTGPAPAVGDSLPVVGFSRAVGDLLTDPLTDTSLPVADPSLPVVGFSQTGPALGDSLADILSVADTSLPTVESTRRSKTRRRSPTPMQEVKPEKKPKGRSAGADAWTRTDTTHDLQRVAARFGGDLACADLDALPSEWLNEDSARRVLMEAGLSPGKIDVLEVYAGSARWTQACEAAMLRAGPRVDNLGGDQWDLTTEGSRRILWAVVVQCGPKWIHSGFPCTFWSPLSQWTRKLAVGDMEDSRTCALVHVILTCQLARWQHNKGYHVSFENPPAARSWKLDIVQNTLATIGANTYKTDSCAWGHVDPISGKPVKKQQCLASTANLSGLVRRCSCYSGPGRCPAGVHEVVHGTVAIQPAVGGTMRSIRRSKWAAAYPEKLCREWAAIVRSNI